MKGVLFDFNGVLFEDSEFHEQAWKETARHLKGKELTDKELTKHFHGRQNRAIFEFLLGSPLTEEKCQALEIQKESLYREICIQNRSKLVLTKGASALFDKLAQYKIPYTIVTSSCKENLDFYFDIFQLSRWFSLDRIVYADGITRGKPDPDPYLYGAQKLNLRISDCIVFEDAPSGILSAKVAGAGLIIGYGPTSKHENLIKHGANQVITSFESLNIESFIAISQNNKLQFLTSRGF